ncbi:POK9 protein, partial [Phaetusa simplex]|nr:POK9 protein [Phaetusa simplex]
ETKQAVSQYGLSSPFTRSLIEHLFTANLLTPHDTKQIIQIAGCLDHCAAATAGSAGVDLATAVNTTLVTSAVALIDSDQRGPLGHGLSALLIGHSSVSRQGIFVVPGLIDADYTGIIKIMVYTLTPPITIPQGSKIAQLIPFQSMVPRSLTKHRGTGSFGSTGSPEVLLAIDIARGKPEEKVIVMHPLGSSVTMLIDTGADVTILPTANWPSAWPLVPAAMSVVGVEGPQRTMISQT